MRDNGERAGSGKELQLVTLKGLGVERIESHRWQRVAGLDDETFETLIVARRPAFKVSA
jgi:hypothetical protein